MGSTPLTTYGVGDDYPVYYVSWDDCNGYVEQINLKLGGDFRLPSEAEWEYACRGSASNPNRYEPFSFGDDPLVSDLNSCQPSNLFAQYMWWCQELGSNYVCLPVAGKQPNDYGLYDMHGNLWEWVLDGWWDNYENTPTDGSARGARGVDGTLMSRGGSCYDVPKDCRSAVRTWAPKDSRTFARGFRLAQKK